MLFRHRLHIDEPLESNREYSLVNERAHYVSRVLRLQENERLELFDGSGRGYFATIVKHSKRTTTLQVHQVSRVEPPIAQHLLVAMSLLKGQAMDRAIQQATELGASHVMLLTSERSNVGFDTKRLANKLAHWRKIIIASCEQCGALTIPTLDPPRSIGDLIAGLPSTTRRIVFDPTGPLLPKSLVSDDYVLCIGPEGGWSSAELDFFNTNDFAVNSVHSRVLRAENFPAVALALVQHALPN
tara:strand:- start:409 stop:1134 length:726 start_codon:yes stop_codon:yes gene_type:complete